MHLTNLIRVIILFKGRQPLSMLQCKVVVHIRMAILCQTGIPDISVEDHSQVDMQTVWILKWNEIQPRKSLETSPYREGGRGQTIGSDERSRKLAFSYILNVGFFHALSVDRGKSRWTSLQATWED